MATPDFFVDSNSPCKSLLFPHGPSCNLLQKPLSLVGTVLNNQYYLNNYLNLRQRIAMHQSTYKPLSLQSIQAFSFTSPFPIFFFFFIVLRKRKIMLILFIIILNYRNRYLQTLHLKNDGFCLTAWLVRVKSSLFFPGNEYQDLANFLFSSNPAIIFFLYIEYRPLNFASDIHQFLWW